MINYKRKYLKYKKKYNNLKHGGSFIYDLLFSKKVEPLIEDSNTLTEEIIDEDGFSRININNDLELNYNEIPSITINNITFTLVNSYDYNGQLCVKITSTYLEEKKTFIAYKSHSGLPTCWRLGYIHYTTIQPVMGFEKGLNYAVTTMLAIDLQNYITNNIHNLNIITINNDYIGEYIDEINVLGEKNTQNIKSPMNLTLEDSIQDCEEFLKYVMNPELYMFLDKKRNINISHLKDDNSRPGHGLHTEDLENISEILKNTYNVKVIDYKRAYNYTSNFVSDTTTYIMRITGIINCAEFIDKKNSENFYLYYTYVKIKYNGSTYTTIVPIIALPYKCKTSDYINMYGIYLEYINLGAYVNKLIEYTSQIISKTNINYINSRYSYIGALWKDLYPFKNNSELIEKIVNEYETEFNVYI